MQNKFSKKLGIIIIALLTISSISVAIPFASATITDRPTVYVNDFTSDPLMVEAGTFVNITTADMTITGAQVWLWLSTYGGSEIDQGAGDRVYAGPFYLGDITNTTAKIIPVSAASVPAPFDAEGRAYSYVVGNGWINGTVPLLVQGSNVDYWIKIADQSPRDIIVGSEVGVSTNRIRFTTGFNLTPMSGAPDTPVTVSGYAVPTGILYNVTQGAYLVDYFVASATHNVSGWLWTGFDVPFNIMDLEGVCTGGHPTTSTITINVINHNTTVIDASFAFTEYFREVYLPTGTFRGCYTDQTGYTLNTGSMYNVTLNWFPYMGSADVYLNTTLVATGLPLNGTGGNGYTPLTIPALVTGDYFFRVIDNFNVEYNFTVHVEMVPYITLTPASGYVGDQFTVTGTNFLDYAGQYITIYFDNEHGAADYLLMWNETIASSSWVTQPLTVPQSWGGPRTVEARIIDGTTVIADAIFTVMAKLTVLDNDTCIDNAVCQVVQVEGTGFNYGGEGEPDDFFFYVDNSLYFGNSEKWVYAINNTGYILTEFAAAGFRPGLHVVSVIADYEGDMPWAIYAKDNFCISTVGDPIVAYLEGMNATVMTLDGTIATLSTTVGEVQVDLAAVGATIDSISGNVATIKTDVGTIKSSLTTLSASVSSVSGGMATIQTSIGQVITELTTLDTVIGSMYGDVVALDTSIGSVETSLDALDATVSGLGDDMTAVAGDVVSIDTVLGSVAGTVTSMEGTLATIETDLGTAQVDLAYLKGASTDTQATLDENLPVDMMPVWIAVILSLIAAIGAIAGVFIIQRKIA